jgi:hypothetical protein
MRFPKEILLEVREVLWLASVIGGLSVLGVALAVALVVALESWQMATSHV